MARKSRGLNALQRRVNRLYERIVEKGEENVLGALPTGWPQDKNLKKLLKLTDVQHRVLKRAQIDAEFGQKYPDWQVNRAKLWRLARKHPQLTGDEIYWLWKSKKRRK